MSLPPGFLDEIRSRISLSAIVGRKVTWDLRKSNQARGDWWAPCPFHQEKTASFHVDDRKGFYYCFGCHAKGDALTFLQQAENMPFLEAVETLAREAGLPMPQRDPRAAEKADRRSELARVLDEAVKFYRLQLKTSAGAAARDYLSRQRRLPEPAWERWDIGWAPENGQALVAALAAKGIPPEQMIAAGVVAKSDGGRLYDRFHGRITFPIRDARGRAISFGGRSLDPNARAKYLNGNETELFDKGRTLFNHGPAREAAGKGRPLIVAEGYMDVIALVEAGFTAALAPMGTAVTEEQLRLIWRIADEPIIALDGDAAGISAGLRVADLALPLLEAGKGLRFALLPGGMDPDDLIRTEGAAAMQKVLDAAQPMVRLLWQRETEGQDFSSPERQAALEARLNALTASIRDRLIRERYGQTLRQMTRDFFWSLTARKRATGKAGGRRRGEDKAPPAGTTRNSLLAAAQAPEDTIREAVILAALIRFPALVARFETSLERLEPSTEDHTRLRNLLLTHFHDSDCRARIAADSPAALDRLMAHPHVRIAPPMLPRNDEEFAAVCIEVDLAALEANRAHRIEMAEAELGIAGLADESQTWRVFRATDLRNAASRGMPKEQKGETILAPNGVEQDREELERARRLYDQIDPTRGGRSRP